MNRGYNITRYARADKNGAGPWGPGAVAFTRVPRSVRRLPPLRRDDPSPPLSAAR